jgi:hypothetical protein
VDFLHQFCRRVVSKEDKTLPWRLPACCFARSEGFAAGIFRKMAFGRPVKNTLDLIRGAVSDCKPMDR